MKAPSFLRISGPRVRVVPVRPDATGKARIGPNVKNTNREGIPSAIAEAMNDFFPARRGKRPSRQLR